ncbi:MAG TPA: fumarylacetoacetate hydrolase family protein [Vicinamibacterales bacterium]|nr:fumarylacetoacetate hydrolase family protein [Vicinamibacterales bacterium]
MDRLYRIDHQGSAGYAVERDGVLCRTTGDVFGSYSAGAAIAGGLNAPGLKMLPPVTPSKIVCVGLNYKDHAAETGKPLPSEPLLFIKPSTAVIGPGHPIRVPPGVGRIDYEAELGIVIGRRAHRVPRAKAWDFVGGLICVNDVTARDLQKKESQFTRCKGFDTFAPIGPCIAVESGASAGAPRMVESYLNGERRQSSSTRELIFPIDVLVEFITFVMTLEPGDIIATGTPAGIAPMKHGDRVTIMVEGVGELTNPVEAEA